MRTFGKPSHCAYHGCQTALTSRAIKVGGKWVCDTSCGSRLVQPILTTQQQQTRDSYFLWLSRQNLVK